jgi:hypothetical protein
LLLPYDFVNQVLHYPSRAILWIAAAIFTPVVMFGMRLENLKNAILLGFDTDCEGVVCVGVD